MDYHIEHTTACLPVPAYLADYRDAEKFIGFCRACHQYGNCWACPPYDFDPGQEMARYRQAWLIGTRITPGAELRATCTDPEAAKALSRDILADVRQELDRRLLELEARHPGSRAFFAGTCFSCPAGTCTRPKGLPCVRPQKVRPSLEAFGFDIGKTSAELLGIELQWSADGSLPAYFTLVSGLFTPEDAEIRWE